MVGIQAKVTYQGTTISQPHLVVEMVPIIRETHHRLTRKIRNEAQHRAPDDSGNLKRQIREDPAYFTGVLTMHGGVTSHAPYSLYVHEGTRAHDIEASPGHVLSFPWHGGRAFFKDVHHPGTRARPFMYEAMLETIATDPDVELL